MYIPQVELLDWPVSVMKCSNSSALRLTSATEVENDSEDPVRWSLAPNQARIGSVKRRGEPDRKGGKVLNRRGSATGGQEYAFEYNILDPSCKGAGILGSSCKFAQGRLFE